MDETIGSYDYCICLLEEPTVRTLAERLINEVSNYKLPKIVQNYEVEPSYKKGCILALKQGQQITREQLDLLDNSRWLMVVCTKQTRAAYNISQIVNYFACNKGKAFILPILLEGEPQDAFPPEFFEERSTTVTFGDGTTQNIKEIIEPLAIDIRAKDLKASLSLLHHIRIKIVAALIGVSYDTLEQRHEKRTRRRLKILITFLLAVPIVLGSIFTYLWLNSQHQINIATKKTQISKDLLANMCQNYPDLFKDIPEALPVVNTLLINSLEKLRVAESGYISLLSVDNLLLPDESDDLELVRNKAKILRYLGKNEEAKEAYVKLSQMLEGSTEDFEAAASLFVEKADITDHPSGIWVKSIAKDVSDSCDRLSNGDIIVAVNGFSFRSYDQFQAYVYLSLPPGQKAKMTILRPGNGDFQTIDLDIKPENLVFESEEI